MQRYQTRINFTCPSCKHEIATLVGIPEPDLNALSRTGNSRSEGFTMVPCPMCGGWYPGFARASATGTEVTLNVAPNSPIKGPPPSYGEYEQEIPYAVPADPFAVFMDTYHHTGDILAEYGGHGGHLINRMVFVQLVAALEAYLGDTLINTVMNNANAFKRLVSADRELSKERYALSDVVADPDFVRTRVRVYLKSVLYHNLEKVSFLYKTTSDIELLHGPANSEKLFKAIIYRHDCVHRNGYDKDGKKLAHFTKEYITDIADQMKALVEMIEKAVRALSS